MERIGPREVVTPAASHPTCADPCAKGDVDGILETGSSAPEMFPERRAVHVGIEADGDATEFAAEGSDQIGVRPPLLWRPWVWR